MNRILKPVRRFWRGLSGRLRAALILFLVLALSLAAFGVYLLVKPEDEKSPSLKAPDPLFTAIGREDLEKIYLYPKDGTPYSVERYLYKNNGSKGQIWCKVCSNKFKNDESIWNCWGIS